MFQACELLKSTMNAVHALRNDESFVRIFKLSIEKCKNCNISLPECISSDIEVESNMPRNTARESRKLPQHLCNCLVMSTLGQRSNRIASNTSYLAAEKEQLKGKMFEVIDRIEAELSRRFKDNEPCLIACETVHPSSDNFMNFEHMKALLDLYSCLKFDVDKLKSEINIAKDMCLNAKSEYSDVSTFLMSFKCNEKFIFPNLLSFVNLVNTLPVSSSQAERSFSTMKRVKNYLRSTINDDMLANLSLISIEKDFSSNLMQNPLKIVDHFAENGKRRLLLNYYR